jgi:hypothetical protein
MGANKVGAPYYPKDWGDMFANWPTILIIALVFALMLTIKFGRVEEGEVDSEVQLRGDVYTQWRRTPIHDRVIEEIKKQHPGVAEDQVREAISRSEKLIEAAFQEAEKHRIKSATKKQGIDELEKSHPGFPKDLYKTAWGNGMQDAMH